MTLKPTMQLTLWLIIWVAFVLLSAPLMAADAVSKRTTKSISYNSDALSERSARDESLKQAEEDIDDALIKQSDITESTVRVAQLASLSSIGISDSIIYDVTTDLISDLDYDGFYHRFSVTIDADTIYDVSYVYAKLYLSYEGGPWNQYATSNNYHIYLDSEADRFIIETELGDGYPTGYYDIRVELYDADNGDWLDTYGPTEDASLIGLPLEDSYVDSDYVVAQYPIETEVIVTGHGHGAMSWWLIIMPVLLGVIRRLKRNSQA